jgi:heterodisulfide reductase subunit B2
MKAGLYPGCSLEGSSREYAESLLAIAPHIGLELTEMEHWKCCGASAAHSLDHTLSISLPAQVLAHAEQQQMPDLLVPCAACFNRLSSAKLAMKQDESLRIEIAAGLSTPYTGSTNLHNILDVLSTSLTPEIISRMPATFPHKVACYYGCLLVRPSGVVHTLRPEDPVSMDEIMKRIGAMPLAWGMKTECCGAGLSVTRTDIVGDLCAKILSDAVVRGAEAIIVACPMCHSNLDMRRQESNRIGGQKFIIPVLYITQAIGLALGIEPVQLGLQRHFVHVDLRGKTKAQPAAQPKVATPA